MQKRRRNKEFVRENSKKSQVPKTDECRDASVLKEQS